MIPSISKICPLFAERDQNPPRFLTKPSQILPNSSPDFPKSSKIPSQIDQESKKIRSIMILLTFQRPRCVQEAAKSAQKRPKTVLNPSQMMLKTLPKPSQNDAPDPSKIYIEFSLFFPCFFAVFLKLEPLILLISPKENAIFYKISSFKKNANGLRDNIPKSFQNPREILPGSSQIRSKIEHT